jgi:hypothetical protein
VVGILDRGLEISIAPLIGKEVAGVVQGGGIAAFGVAKGLEI